MISYKKLLSLLCAFLFMCGALFSALTPEVHAAEEDIITVMLDPGHAFGDGGGTYAGNHPECYYNMIIALACKEALEAHGGFEVYLSHPDNYTKATLLERGMAADKVNADVIVSLHIDGNADPNFRGASSFYSVIDKFALPELANSMLANVSAKTGLGNRGSYRRKDTGDGTHIYYWNAVAQWDVPDDTTVGPLSDYYGIITWGAKFGIPTVILEHGFLTNAEDRAIIENEEMLKVMGQTDAQSIIDFYTDHVHNWSSSRSVDYPSNCVFRGKSSYRCSVCKARKDTVSLEAAANGGHYYIVTSSQKRSCTVAGHTTYTCRIAANLTDKGYDVGQHTYTKWDYNTGHNYAVITDTQPTHTEDGIHSERCQNCGNVVTTVIPAEQHSWEILSHLDNTCETDGYTHEKCTACKEERRTELPAMGHSEIVVDALNPTCVDDGYIKRQCTTCQKETTEVLPALGHNMEMVLYTIATCESDGQMVMRCSVCAHEDRTVLAAIGHSFVEDKVLLAPTFFKHGEQHLVCAHNSAHETTAPLSRTATDWQLLLVFGGIPHLFFLLIFLIILLVRWIKTTIPEMIAKIKEAKALAATKAESEENADDAPTEEIEAESADDVSPMEELDLTEVEDIIAPEAEAEVVNKGIAAEAECLFVAEPVTAEIPAEDNAGS